MSSPLSAGVRSSVLQEGGPYSLYILHGEPRRDKNSQSSFDYEKKECAFLLFFGICITFCLVLLHSLTQQQCVSEQCLLVCASVRVCVCVCMHVRQMFRIPKANLNLSSFYVPSQNLHGSIPVWSLAPSVKLVLIWEMVCVNITH